MLNDIKEILLFLAMLGIPTIFSLTVWCIKLCNNFTKQLNVLMESQQAQMRAALIKDYKFYIKQGWIDIDDLDEWENSYQKYHMLGANGVMDAKRQDLLHLPNVKPHN